MNAFRLVFLFSVLTAAVLLLFVAQAPPVFENMRNDQMVLRAEAEARNIVALEAEAAARREAAVARIAQAPALVGAMSPAEPTLGADGVPALPRRAAPDAAMASAVEAVAASADVNLTLVALYDSDGTVIYPTRDVGILAPDQLSTAAGVVNLMATDADFSGMAAVGGRLYGVAAQPVRSADGAVVGLVALAEEYTGQLVATRRDPTSAHLTYFVGRDVVAGTDSDAARAELAASVVRRISAMNIGTRTGLRLTEFNDVHAPEGSAGDGLNLSQTVLNAPVEIGSAGDSIVGVVVTVDGPTTPNSLFGILIEGQAFAESTLKLWVYLALGLFVFFGGLALHDWGLGRGVNRLAESIRAAVTNNDPPTLPELNYPASLRPIARAYNGFVDAYRSQMSTARRAREEAENARHAAEQALSAADTALAAADTAREEMERVRSESSTIGSQPQIELGRLRAPAPTQPAAYRPVEPPPTAPLPPYAAPTAPSRHANDFDREDSSVNRLAASFLAEQPDDSGSNSSLGSLDDLADAMAADDDIAASEQRDQDGMDDLSGFEAAFNFDGPSIRGTEAVFEMLPAAPSDHGLPEEANVPKAAPAADPNDVTAPPPGAAAPLRAGPPPMPGPASTGGTMRMSALTMTESGAVPIARMRPAGPPPLSPRVTGPTAPVSAESTPAASEPAAAAAPAVDAPSGVSPRRSTATPMAIPAAESVDSFEPLQLPEPEQTSAPTAPTPKPAVAARTGVVGKFQGVFDEPPVDELIDAVDSLNDRQAAGTVPRVTTAELARRAAEEAAARASVNAQVAQPAAVPQALVGNATTKPSIPTDSILAAAEERLKRLRANTGALNAVPSNSVLPGVNAPAAPPAPAAPAIEGDSPATRALYDDFMRARHQCGELDELPYERFARRLEKQRAALKQQLNCVDVRFRVDTEGGKATLKATPVR